MNSQKPQNDFKFSAGYFGKLPNYPDFVKYNAASQEILNLDKWIQEGILAADKSKKNNFSMSDQPKSGWRDFYNSSSPIKFLFPFTRTENIILGIIHPSRDKTGREFPFIIFVNIRKSTIGNIPAYLFPLSFSESFDFFSGLFSEIKLLNPSGKENLSVVNNKFNHQSLPSFIQKDQVQIFLANSISSYENFLMETFYSEFRERVLEDHDGSRSLTLLNNLGAGLSFLRSKPDVSISFGIKISFIYNQEYSYYDLGVFINITLIIARKTSHFPALFFKNENSYTHLYIFFCNPLPRHFIDLFYDGGSEERILNANDSAVRMEMNFIKNTFFADADLKLKYVINELQKNKSSLG